MVRIYITGKWSDKELIKGYMYQLQKLGHTITHDWTNYIYDSNNTFTKSYSDNKSDKAFKNVQGIAFSELTIIFISDDKDSFAELGVALGLLKDIYIICPDENNECRTNKFFHHPSIEHMKTWDECLSKLQIFDK